MTLKEWVQKWKETAKRLEEIRDENIRLTNTNESILSFNDAFEHLLKTSNPKPTSGLVTQQKIFQKLRKSCKN